MKEKNLLKIGNLAKEAGVTVQTVRYYAKLGLLKARRKSQKAARTFHKDDLERLRMIRGLQSLDLPLERIVQLLEIRGKSDTGNEAQKRLASALSEEIVKIDQRITGYLKVKESLLEVLETSQGCTGCEQKPDQEVCGICGRPQGCGKDLYRLTIT